MKSTDFSAAGQAAAGALVSVGPGELVAVKPGELVSVGHGGVSTTPTMPTNSPLTVVQRRDLARCEKIIEKGLQTFREVGNALIEIKEKSLYRNDYATFQDYCQERWGFSRQRAHQLIQGAKVAERMSTAVDTPIPNERVARELNRVPSDQQVHVWQESVERADGVPTADDVRAVVGGQLGDPGDHGARDPADPGDHGDQDADVGGEHGDHGKPTKKQGRPVGETITSEILTDTNAEVMPDLTAKVAQMVDVPVSMVEAAGRLLASGRSDLIQAVDAGTMHLNDAIEMMTTEFLAGVALDRIETAIRAALAECPEPELPAFKTNLADLLSRMVKKLTEEQNTETVRPT
jgi:hypothetical protein